MTTDQCQKVKSQGHVTYQQPERYGQRMVVSTSKLGGNFHREVRNTDTLSRSAGQLDRK